MELWLGSGVNIWVEWYTYATLAYFLVTVSPGAQNAPPHPGGPPPPLDLPYTSPIPPLHHISTSTSLLHLPISPIQVAFWLYRLNAALAKYDPLFIIPLLQVTLTRPPTPTPAPPPTPTPTLPLPLTPTLTLTRRRTSCSPRWRAGCTSRSSPPWCGGR